MARNVEVKARTNDPLSLIGRAQTLATAGPFNLEHVDTFFDCPGGRLKLRDFVNGKGELLFYRRANDAGPKESFYLRHETSAPAELRDILTQAYGAIGEVSKHRTVFLIGRTRVHIDDVARLGHFVELEVALADGEPAEAGRREVEELMHKLGISSKELIRAAYMDLIADLAVQPTNRSSAA